MKYKLEYDEKGFTIVRGLFSPEEVATLRDHYMAINAAGPKFTEGNYNKSAADPLRQFPRLMQPHRDDAVSMSFMLDSRIGEVYEEILGSLPYGVQTMVYFKPAGARGQALHQDQRYLRVHPGTCTAAWLALDRCDEENGCMKVVPGSHRFDVICPIKSDTTRSFTDETVPIPDGYEVVDVIMEPGDVLFFDGNLIHGSEPNTSKDRFRRIVVGHYVHADAEQVGYWYNPAYRFDGSALQIPGAEGATTCGTFVDAPDGVAFEMNGTVEAALAAH
jgi:ectoine hydroxylase-related dioxygenase (phytanoyl-CoA dioxygenase family)